MSGYRPDWISDNKPTYNCGSLLIIEGRQICSNDTAYCLLMPLKAECWDKIKVGDILFAMEGPKEVGSAKVICIIGE